jgi:anti-sigma B factor antagonist
MFDVVVSEDGSVRTIELVGECDLQMFPDVTELFSESLNNGNSAVRIDLRRLTFIDSSGIRALLLAVQEAQGRPAKLTIVPGPPNVMSVFELVGLQDAFPFEGSDGA